MVEKSSLRNDHFPVFVCGASPGAISSPVHLLFGFHLKWLVVSTVPCWRRRKECRRFLLGS